MRWSKIKNIILLLLVMVNLCLLFIVGSRFWQSEHSDRELRERMVVILQRNGIEFLPEEVPGEMLLTGRQIVLSPLGESQAAVLIGSSVPSSVAGGTMTFQGEWGSAIFFSDGSFDVRFVPGARPLYGKSLAEVGFELLSGLELNGEKTFQQEDRVVFTQLWKGVPIPKVTLTLTSQDGALDRFWGRLLVGTETGIEGEYLSAPTALTRFLEDLQKQAYVCSQIVKLYPGYSVSGSGPVILTPAWYLETDAGWRCAVNGATGTVSVEDPAYVGGSE